MPRYPQTVLVSCEIPWDERERLVEDVFRKEVRMVLELGFNHLYVFGTAGEGYAVDTARFRQIVRVFREETSGDGIHPQVGVIGLSTANVVERVAIAHDAGFRTFQISLPSWGAPAMRPTFETPEDTPSTKESLAVKYHSHAAPSESSTGKTTRVFAIK